MTVMEFFGCTFIALGPPFALFCFTIAKDPVKIIILIASAFFWLLALLLSSLVSELNIEVFEGPFLVSVILAVIFQELLRFVVYILLRKAETGLSKVATDGSTRLIDNKHILAYVAGLGFGIMSGAFSLINLLAESVGPGTIGIRQGNDNPNFLIISALTTLCFILLNTAWGVIFFYALDHKKFLLILIVVLMHIAASVATTFNADAFYFASLLPDYIILIISFAIALRVTGGRVNYRDLFAPLPLNVPAPEETVVE